MNPNLFIRGEMRTFADKKGAMKAIKRDLAKHFDVHGDVILDTKVEAQEADDGRWGVVVYCDNTRSHVEKVLGEELNGYAILPELPEKEVKAEKQKPASRVKAAPKPKSTRRSGEVNVDPQTPLLPCRPGSKQQLILDAIAKGATLDDLRRVCVKADGRPWDDNSIRSALYYDIHQKGYGVRTVWNGEVPTYHVVLPAGYTEPLPAKGSKS